MLVTKSRKVYQTDSFTIEEERYSISSQEDDSLETQNLEVKPCVVCRHDASKLHGCVSCSEHVHIFCGIPIPGSEQGYGQKAQCPTCALLSQQSNQKTFSSPKHNTASLPPPSSDNLIRKRKRTTLQVVEGNVSESCPIHIWCSLQHLPFKMAREPLNSFLVEIVGKNENEWKLKVWESLSQYIEGNLKFFCLALLIKSRFLYT